jgi:hypothetical protein
MATLVGLLFVAVSISLEKNPEVPAPTGTRDGSCCAFPPAYSRPGVWLLEIQR